MRAGRKDAMSSKKPPHFDQIIRAAETLPMFVEEFQEILNQPALPPDHRDAEAQRRQKASAQANLDQILTLLLKWSQQIIDTPPLPPDHPHAAMLQEEKRRAQTTLLHWNAHYGPGGPYEGLGPKGR
jgi:hypothetical protein